MVNEKEINRLFQLYSNDFDLNYMMQKGDIFIIFKIPSLFTEEHIVFKKKIKSINYLNFWEVLFKLAVILFRQNNTINAGEEFNCRYVSSQTNDFSFIFSDSKDTLYYEVTKKDIIKYLKKL